MASKKKASASTTLSLAEKRSLAARKGWATRRRNQAKLKKLSKKAKVVTTHAKERGKEPIDPFEGWIPEPLPTGKDLELVIMRQEMARQERHYKTELQLAREYNKHKDALTAGLMAKVKEAEYEREVRQAIIDVSKFPNDTLRYILTRARKRSRLSLHIQIYDASLRYNVPVAEIYNWFYSGEGARKW
jgi:hypothetical protein